MIVICLPQVIDNTVQFYSEIGFEFLFSTHYIIYFVLFPGNNAARTIGGEYVPSIVALYNDWHHADTKHRHVTVRKGLLNILKNITNLSK